ncbi:MAG: glycosyltransferase [Promethearchaeota archaeon]
MKKVLIISCFIDKIENARPYLAYKFFRNNYDTKVIYSEFSHTFKKYIKYEDEHFIPIKTLGYKRNISFSRILSHIIFALKIKGIIKKEKPDLIYVAIPPNAAAYSVIKIADKNKKTKVIIDIVDIWPETLPIPIVCKRYFNFFVGWFWKYLRNYALKRADYIICQSNYFKQKLALKGNNIQVIHLAKIIKYREKATVDAVSGKVIKIAYLGSMNTITDFDTLLKISKTLGLNNIEIILIGDGERKDWLLSALKESNIKYTYFGKIFEEEKKKEILNKCDFGFNGYKSDTEVALSYKSIDYLSYGLPLINSAKNDTWDCVERYKIGFNYNKNTIDQLIENLKILNCKELEKMKKNAYQCFLENFTWDKYEAQMSGIVNYLNF